jgi:glycosyltransferase involved in cell wall biosynthesis
MKRVLLLSTVHPPTDPRIVYKIAPLLASNYQVTCVLPDLVKSNHTLFDTIRIPFFNRLVWRMLLGHPVVLWKCLRLRPDIVHIFVPELIPIAVLFHWLGAQIVYEVQENLYKKFSIKTFNNAKVFKLLFAYFDQLARRKFHLVFTEDAYLHEYDNLKNASCIIRNFPSIQQANFHQRSQKPDLSKPEFLYIGVISMERCIDVLILACSKLKVHFPDFIVHLFGPLRLNQKTLETLPGYNLVRDNLIFHGYTNQQVAFTFASRCIAGIALLKPAADYPDSYTTKLFEYMALRLPVITSDFPLYRSVVEPSQCGFCISPYDDQELFEKMKMLVENSALNVSMGNLGRKSVENFYNWDQEAQNLLSFYVNILSANKSIG